MITGIAGMMTGTLLLSLFGCSGESTERVQEGSAEVVSVWSASDVERTWVFKAADGSWRGQFEGDPGWTGLFNRDYESALSGASGVGAIRMYSEFASVYRQATLMHAHASRPFRQA